MRSVLRMERVLRTVKRSELRCCSSNTPHALDKKAISASVFLPKSDFPSNIDANRRAKLDNQLSQLGKFDEYYQWQLRATQRATLPIFKLLDGPPYANGGVHVGHALNKLLKDFTVRYRAMSGRRVLYRPGWDCHGLPIEMVAVSKQLVDNKNNHPQSPIQRRTEARTIAENSISEQMCSFRRWGTVGDWQHPYLTMDPKYEAAQLRLFWTMYDKGLIYRAYKPVHWSPSSVTAVADSELEYNEQHLSRSVHFRFKLINFPLAAVASDLVNNADLDKTHFDVYAVIWTTTPWTLPLNNAIAYAPQAKYMLAEVRSKARHVRRNLHIFAEPALAELKEAFGDSLVIHGTFDGELLSKCYYVNCMWPEVGMPFVPANHVSLSTGTGLVHTAFAHGFEDFKLSEKLGAEVECHVTEDGRFTRSMGHELFDKPVIGEGETEVLKLLKQHVISVKDYIHSYPYDWRTKKPVIIRASAQWFIDTKVIAAQATDLVKQGVIHITSGGTRSPDLSALFLSVLENRPPWCISRQRVWGVPVPVFYRINGEPVISKSLVDRISDLVEERGSDCWWEMSVGEIITAEIRTELGLTSEDELVKGSDIMDVWLDSGVAWRCAVDSLENDMEGNREADVVIEGMDQFRGWFQSLLLTSLAAVDRPPYCRILVHGFCVDEHGNKMSKSVGNVIHPDGVTDGTVKQDGIGVDGLRLWAAMHGSVPVPLTTIDQYMLVLLRNHLRIQNQHYEQFAYRSVINHLLNFIKADVSAFYVTVIRDRLYCDPLNSATRHSAQYTLDTIGRSLIGSVTPILPHLALEFYSHHPLTSSDPYEQLKVPFPSLESFTPSREETNLMSAVELARSMFANFSNMVKSKTATSNLVITCTSEHYSQLSSLQECETSCTSDLVQLLAAATVTLRTGHVDSSLGYDLNVTSDSALKVCIRCRRKVRSADDSFCQRCTEAIDIISQSRANENGLKAAV